MSESIFKADRAIILSAALLDMSLLGFVGQQYYTYWTGGFKDRIYLKLFVHVQFALVVLQAALMWHLIFINFTGTAVPPNSPAQWSGPVNSLVQLFLIIFANIFLATRIRSLTKSLVQSLTPMFFSIIAFVFGMVTLVGSAWTNHSESYKYGTSVVWYTSQTVADCLISFFLVRALLKARSGIQRSDSMVKYLVRNVIQTAALATMWSIAALVSWFWLKRIVVFSIFTITSGSVYTHAIFDTLISRTHLRDRMAATSAYVDLYPSTQSQPGRFPGHVMVSNVVVSDAPHSNSGSDPGTTLADKNDTIELGKVPGGKPGTPYDF